MTRKIDKQEHQLKRYSFIHSLIAVTVIALFTSLSVNPAGAQRDRQALPAVLCAIVNSQLVCYDPSTAKPSVVSQNTSDQRVTDFAIAPDRNWVVYRTGNTVWTAPINGPAASYPIDTEAPLPADVSLIASTLTWSPDGLSVAYVTASGFRVAFPPQNDLPNFVDLNDRPYVNLHFSATGLRLAAQSADGSWRIFAIDTDRHVVQPTRTIEQPGELAWFDDGSFVVAFLSGGLTRYASDDPSQTAQWTVPDQHYIKLFSSTSGDVYAINPDPGDTIGSSVTIRPDGTVTRLGDSKIDSRVRWGPDGTVMYYIASGVPILVDRATGAEDMLPVKGVSRVLWATPFNIFDGALSGADQFFIQSDNAGIKQVWRRTNINGLRPQQITRELTNHVDDYAISADQLAIVYTSAGRLIAMPIDNPDKQTVLASVPRTPNAQTNSGGVLSWPVWNPSGKEVAFASSDSVYTVSYMPTEGDSTEEPPVLTLIKQATDSASYQPASYSPDGEWILTKVVRPNSECAYLAIQRQTRQERAIETCPSSILWSNDNSLLMLVNGIPQFLPPDGSTSRTLTDWPAAGAKFDKDGMTIIVFRTIGWQHGPSVVQPYIVDDNGVLIVNGRPQLQSLLQPQH